MPGKKTACVSRGVASDSPSSPLPSSSLSLSTSSLLPQLPQQRLILPFPPVIGVVIDARPSSLGHLPSSLLSPHSSILARHSPPPPPPPLHFPPPTVQLAKTGINRVRITGRSYCSGDLALHGRKREVQNGWNTRADPAPMPSARHQRISPPPLRLRPCSHVHRWHDDSRNGSQPKR